MTVVPKLVEKLRDTIVENIVAGVAMSVFIDRQGHAYWCGQGNGGLEQVTTKILMKEILSTHPCIANC